MNCELKLIPVLYFHTSASQYAAKWSSLIPTQFCPGVPQAFLQLCDELAQETEISVHKMVLFNQILPDPAHYPATSTMLAQGRGKFRKRRVKRKSLIVWLQKKFGCSVNCSLKTCQQNASWYLILMIRGSKFGLTTCSVNMQDRSNNIWLYQRFLPLLERACSMLSTSTLSILFNKNYLDINYGTDEVTVNHPLQKGGESFKHANHMFTFSFTIYSSTVSTKYSFWNC